MGSIMIMGTMSDVGKSFLVAGLCRLFRQDGYRIAPFKSQNMALNSYVTPDGLEIGRAQAMQAEAAGIPCDARMNPILLKPTADHTSQVILNGKIHASMDAAEYYRKKRQFLPDILSAYHSLQNEYDIVVIEGAGSPAEINLRENDIVNMGLAEAVDAPVLLVGDIDRGGVFAQLLGTLLLLSEKERERVKGLVINRFRGDKGLLMPGLKELSERTNKRVYGVIPYMDIALDDEDSLSESLLVTKHHKPVDIAVIRLPHISNFTDFAPMARHPLLGVRYVSHAGQLGTPDAVILPGTKSTMDDLVWLKESALADAVAAMAEEGVPVIGICGGFQMLGKELYNPEHTEGKMEGQQGLSLLPVTTVFTEDKVLRRSEMRMEKGIFSGLTAQGYEIHAARTYGRVGLYGDEMDGQPAEDSSMAPGWERTGEAVWDRDHYAAGSERSGAGETTCIYAAKGNVFGTYLHGFFDEAGIVERLAEYLAGDQKAKAKEWHIPEDGSLLSVTEFKERQYDALAGLLREHLDMEAVYRLIT
ncbi:MAG: cobyric acid synthase [Lachnospiraceae bacterium]|nr:cobyric acid synthase [Lachnospiraceae bacterium]